MSYDADGNRDEVDIGGLYESETNDENFQDHLIKTWTWSSLSKGLDQEKELKPISSIDLLLTSFGLLVYFAGFALDYKLLRDYYYGGEIIYFTMTVTFIAAPLILIQIMSCKMFFTELGAGHLWYKLLTVIVHVLMMGPVQRYCIKLWYGFKCRQNVKEEYYNIYWKQANNIDLFNCLRSFWEDAPQAVIQLFIIFSGFTGFLNRVNEPIFGGDISFTNLSMTGPANDFFIIIKVIFTVLSLTFSASNYVNSLRIHRYGMREIPISTTIFQCLYRLFFNVSRILVLALFVVVCHAITVIILLVFRITLLIHWIRVDLKQAPYVVNADGKESKVADGIFYATFGVLHIYCFINWKDGRSRSRVVPYYILFFSENAAMVAVWIFANRIPFGIEELGVIIMVVTCSMLGIVFMIIYYKVFHPTLGVSCIRNQARFNHRMSEMLQITAPMQKGEISERSPEDHIEGDKESHLDGEEEHHFVNQVFVWV